jgi:hypothetical protein
MLLLTVSLLETSGQQVSHPKHAMQCMNQLDGFELSNEVNEVSMYLPQSGEDQVITLTQR